MSVIRKCVCCDKEYEFCPSCKKKDQPAWMVSFCSEPCKGLFNIVSAYNAKRVGKGTVQAYIAEHKITDLTKYTEPVKRVLEEVKATPNPVKVEAPKVEVKEEQKVMPVVELKKEEPKAEPIIEEPKIEVPVVKPVEEVRPRRRRRRR